MERTTPEWQELQQTGNYYTVDPFCFHIMIYIVGSNQTLLFHFGIVDPDTCQCFGIMIHSIDRHVLCSLLDLHSLRLFLNYDDRIHENIFVSYCDACVNFHAEVSNVFLLWYKIHKYDRKPTYVQSEMIFSCRLLLISLLHGADHAV